MTIHHKPVALFLSYAHEDESHLRELEKHLSLLQRQGVISIWHDRQIAPGINWAESIDAHMEQASVILLLVSPDFLASDYCYSIEMQYALERHRQKKALVVPILLRPIDWEIAPFAHLQGLPRDGKFITTWDNQDIAFSEVARELRHIIEVGSLSLSTSTSSATRPSLWNIPYLRNPVFTGREQILGQLANVLRTGQAIALSQPQIQAISGLGGVGKSQIAIEYAYRHQQDYQAIFWIRADTPDAIITGYLEMAQLLDLLEKHEQDQQLIIKAVQEWLKTQTRWLLILDNADELAMVREFLPSTFGGHILLTTRSQSMGRLATARIEVDTMNVDVGALFLLRRAGLIAHDASLEMASPLDITLARAITEELGGLPLAIDQAGAYIEETGCSLSDYQQLYLRRRAELLKRRGGLIADHPEPVTTTWSLSFEKIEQASLAAAELLRLCAFLHPESIPEEVVLYGATHLGPVLTSLVSDPIALNEVIALLRSYSLISRDSVAKILSVHRLVQAILQDTMDLQMKRQWVEHIVLALEEAIPHMGIATWERCRNHHCESSVSHAQVCTIWIGPKGLYMSNAAAATLHSASG